MTTAERYAENITLPRAIRFPVELIPPEGFDAERPETWPPVAGRLEFVDGRLLYIPPCGQLQQYTVSDVVITLGAWVRAHREFLLGTNEAGMRLQGSTRAADAAVWRRGDVGQLRAGLLHVAPVLAVEVGGDDEDEAALRRKAEWYLAVGVEVAWLVLPQSREVVVITRDGSRRYRDPEVLDPHPSLPDLQPAVRDLFVQITG